MKIEYNSEFSIFKPIEFDTFKAISAIKTCLILTRLITFFLDETVLIISLPVTDLANPHIPFRALKMPLDLIKLPLNSLLIKYL